MMIVTYLQHERVSVLYDRLLQPIGRSVRTDLHHQPVAGGHLKQRDGDDPHGETHPVKTWVVGPPTEPAVLHPSLAGAAKQLVFNNS